MTTFLGMRNKIQDDLNRTDLTTQVNREINRAIRKYASVPFWFSSASQNFNTAYGQQTYDSADGLPSDIRIVDYVRINQSTGTVLADSGTANSYILTPSPAATAYTDGDTYTFEAANANTGASVVNISSLGSIDITRPNGVALQAGDIGLNQTVVIIYNSTAGDFFLRDIGGTYYDVDEVAIDVVLQRNVNDNPGLPLDYAWFNEKMYFYPIPDNTYTVQVYYEKYYADLSADGDSNDFTNNPETEELIESEAEFQLYSNVILDAEQAARCAAMRDIALKRCKTITSNFNGVHGFIRATTF